MVSEAANLSAVMTAHTFQIVPQGRNRRDFHNLACISGRVDEPRSTLERLDPRTPETVPVPEVLSDPPHPTFSPGSVTFFVLDAALDDESTKPNHCFFCNWVGPLAPSA